MKINNCKFKGILTDMLSVRSTCFTVTYKKRERGQGANIPCGELWWSLVSDMPGSSQSVRSVYDAY